MVNFFEGTTCIRSKKESLLVTSIQAHPKTPLATPNTPSPYSLIKQTSSPPISTYFENIKKPIKSSQSYTTSNFNVQQESNIVSLNLLSYYFVKCLYCLIRICISSIAQKYQQPKHLSDNEGNKNLQMSISCSIMVMRQEKFIQT